MGMFDYVRCAYSLPVEGFADRTWQTKDAPGYPSMDLYEIRPDGTLWREDYDIEDHSDPKAEGLMRLRGLMARVRKRWEPVTDFTGELRFYDAKYPDTHRGFGRGWIEFSAYFVSGMLNQLHCVTNRDAD